MGIKYEQHQLSLLGYNITGSRCKKIYWGGEFSHMSKVAWLKWSTTGVVKLLKSNIKLVKAKVSQILVNTTSCSHRVLTRSKLMLNRFYLYDIHEAKGIWVATRVNPIHTHCCEEGVALQGTVKRAKHRRRRRVDKLIMSSYGEMCEREPVLCFLVSGMVNDFWAAVGCLRWSKE